MFHNFVESQNYRRTFLLSSPRRRGSSVSEGTSSLLDSRLRGNDKKNGFTLIEILIIVVIVGMMASLTVANFRSGQEDEALRIDALRIADAIRRAQNYAQSGIHAGTESARAYGVYIKKPDTIAPFADVTGDVVGMKSDGDPPLGAPVLLKVGARSNVSLDAAQGITVDGAQRDEMTIAFRIPDASGLVDGSTNGNLVVITVKNSRNKHTRTVTINRITGRVEAEF